MNTQTPTNEQIVTIRKIAGDVTMNWIGIALRHEQITTDDLLAVGRALSSEVALGTAGVNEADLSPLCRVARLARVGAMDDDLRNEAITNGTLDFLLGRTT